MLSLIITIYITVGIASVFTSAGKWLFNSMIWAIPLLPFMTIYFLIWGDAVKKAEAIEMLKFFGIAIVFFFIFYGVINAFQS